MINAFSISSIIIIVSNFLFAGFLFLKGGKDRTLRLWAYICLLATLWGIAGYKFSTTTSKEISFFWWRIGYIAGIWTPILFYHFIVTFLNLRKKIYRVNFIISFIIGIILILCNLFAPKLFLGDVKFSFGQFYYLNWWISKPFLYLVYYFYLYCFLLPYSFYLLLKEYIVAYGVKKEQLKYFIFGSAIGWLGPHGDYLPAFGINIYPYSNFLIPILTLIFLYAILKHQLMDIKVAITRAGIFLFVYTLVLGIPLWLRYRYHLGDSALWLMCALATAGPLIYRYLQRKAEDILLKTQLAYQGALRELAEKMVHIKELKELFNVIVAKVYEIVNPEFIGIYVYSQDRSRYICKKLLQERENPLNKEVSSSSMLVNVLVEKKEPIVMRIEEDSLPQGTAIIPFFQGDNLYSFLALGQKQDKRMYEPQDIETFGILSANTSLAIDNCLFWEEEKTRFAREEQIRRFQAMDHFSSSMAHEIDNPITCVVGQIYDGKNLLAKLRKDFTEKQNQGIQELEEKLDMISYDVGRIAKLVHAVRDFSRQHKGEFSVIKMDDVMSMFLTIIQPQLKVDNIFLTTNLTPDIVVEGNKIYLVEALMNIGINAIHAVQYVEGLDLHDDDQERASRMKGEKRIDITMSRTNNDKVVIAIKDNGCGIPKDLKDDIFMDFVTTKSSTIGTGMGLSQVRKAVEMHGGRVWYESEGRDKGATFFVELPITKKELPPDTKKKRED